MSSVESAEIAKCRATESKRLTGMVRGDLDCIVMKAIDKERNRRYQSANALAFDVENYMSDEPILARPPSAGYKVAKFVKRNLKAVVAGLLLILACLLGMIGTTYNYLWASYERDIAEQREAEADRRFDLSMEAIDKFHEGVNRVLHS